MTTEERAIAFDRLYSAHRDMVLAWQQRDPETGVFPTPEDAAHYIKMSSQWRKVKTELLGQSDS